MIINEIQKIFPPFEGKNGGRLKDLTGRRFGQLVVLYRGQNLSQIDKHACWVCQCDCGNICVQRSNDLNKNKVVSCGCYKSRILGQRYFIDESNKKYGRLTVIGRANNNSQGSAVWECKCSCGAIVQVSGIDLRGGHVRSCGCIKSWGEMYIAEILTELGIPFKKEYTFNDLRSENNVKLRYDFALFKNKQLYYLIEYDGEQHYKIGANFGQNNYESLIKHDQLKNDYCQEHNIPLLRIPYWIYTKEDIRKEIKNVLACL